MKKGQQEIRIPEAVSKRWWWRRLVFVKFDEETHTTHKKPYAPEYSSYGFSMEWNMWHRKDELEAFRFELLRRLYCTNLPEWIYLPTWLNSWVKGILAPNQNVQFVDYLRLYLRPTMLLLIGCGI